MVSTADLLMEIKMTIVREAVQYAKLAMVQNADGKSGMMVRVRTVCHQVQGGGQGRDAGQHGAKL